MTWATLFYAALILICPLSMIFMMRGMHGGGGMPHDMSSMPPFAWSTAVRPTHSAHRPAVTCSQVRRSVTRHRADVMARLKRQSKRRNHRRNSGGLLVVTAVLGG